MGPLALPSPAPGQLPPGFQDGWQDLSSRLRTSLETSGVVGGSWAFVQGDEILVQESFGMADLASGRAVDEATIYHWGSITKTLTGIAIMQLRDRGLLELDDPILEYVPELGAVHNPFGSMEDITLRHLLSHSSGFRNPTWPWGGSEDWHPHEPTRWEQVVAMLPYTEILFPPGSRYAYSNPGIIFLGQVIERLSGEEWEVYVEKNILRPLGMGRSYFDYTPYHLLEHRSNNYYVRDGEVRANGLDFNTGITVSNGGLNAPLPDMARYLAFWVDAGDPERRALYRKILDRESLEEMWAPEVSIGDTGDLRESMALSFFIEEHRGARYVGHTGSQKAFQAFVYVDPTSGAGAMAAFNTVGIRGDGPPRPATRQILLGLRERFFEEVFPLFRQGGGGQGDGGPEETAEIGVPEERAGTDPGKPTGTGEAHPGRSGP